jgi:CHAT domain-containing protein/tetratricopeptide (TPR) repeat protein
MHFSTLESRVTLALIAGLILALIALAAGPQLHAQSPFRFREAYLLEQRMSPNRGGFTDISHFDENMGRVKPTYAFQDCMIQGCKGPDGKIVSDLDNPITYQGGMWLRLLEQADTSRQQGAFAVAGAMYEEMLSRLRKAQGENSSSVALMLDHLGEYYLEGRNFDKGYQTIQEAVAVRRTMLKTLSPAPPEGTPDPDLQKRLEITMHLADMQTRLGQMDLGKGDLARAHERLSEAVAISNQKNTSHFVSSLFAVYFDSLLLERQDKWQEAENLWKQSVALRESSQEANPYWDCLREMAAFYARREDFHTAAQIAVKIDQETKDKHLKPSIRVPYVIDSRPRQEVENGGYILYRRESDTALKEIEAVDKWQTDGPAGGAALLPAPYVVTRRPLFDLGADSELAQMLSWIEQRAFLHMSILLDGEPSPQQVETAYQLLCGAKGRYLDFIAGVTQYAEYGRNNPGVDTDVLPIMDEMEEAREYQAQLYLQAALDGKPFPSAEFGTAENVQRLLSKMLASDPSISSLTGDISIKDVLQAVPTNAAFLDFVLWNRMDRDGKIPAHREYGVFVLRQGHAVGYMRLGASDIIDKDIDAIKSGTLGSHARGFRVETHGSDISEQNLSQKLKSLYARIIAPLEDDLRGTSQLVIVPDGKITLAPICALIDTRGHALLENYTISYMNSWREISSSVVLGSETAGSSVIVANPDFNLTIEESAPSAESSKRPLFAPLPGSELEAYDIEHILNIPADRVLIGKAGRKWLIQSLTSPEILHLATHTVPSLEFTPPVVEYNLFDIPQPQTSQNPLLQSVIALAGANKPQPGLEDGILTGLEVSRLHLTGTSLVVLSTCESGRGTPVEGLGVLGLRAAFSMAGAQALVMTLWPVDDAAGRQFMQFFYSHLSQGPASALRQAQLDMISKTQYKNPFYWSGYVVSGAPKVDNKPRQQKANVIAPQGKEILIAPRCFDFFMSGNNNGWTFSSNLRLKIGGVVYRQQDSLEQVTYDLNGPGNSIVQRTRNSSLGSYPILNTRGEGRDRWTGTITMQHHSDSSSMILRFGRPSTQLDKREVLTLQGDPKLFPTLSIAESFPGPTAYKVASDSYHTDLKLDRIAACTGTPSW